MFLENLVFDALDPRRLGTFWMHALGAEPLTDSPEGFEARLHPPHPGGPTIDLCFQPVPDKPRDPVRLHLDLLGDTGDPDDPDADLDPGVRRDAVVERLLGLGATHLDVGQGDVPWVVLADVEGNPFCVMGRRAQYVDTGPIASLPLDSSGPERDARFWAELTGWRPTPDDPTVLRHPSGTGPLLGLCSEPESKAAGAKNRLHLDVRRTADESGPDAAQAIEARILELGGRRWEYDAGTVPWTTYLDPSGNEFCVLDPPRHD